MCDGFPSAKAVQRCLLILPILSLWLSTTRPSVYLPTIMVLWGTLTCCMAAVKSYKHLIALRTLLGFLEAGFSPGVILLFSSWYRRDEQSKRFAVYLSAAILSGAFGGLLAGGIVDSLEGSHGIRGWRWLFIIEGVVSIGWAFVSYFLLLDFPANSSRLSNKERSLAVSRLEMDRKIDRSGGGASLGPLRVRIQQAFPLPASCNTFWSRPIFSSFGLSKF